MGPDLPITSKFNSSMIQSKVLMKIKWLINLYGISMAFIFTLKLLLTGPYKKKMPVITFSPVTLLARPARFPGYQEVRKLSYHQEPVNKLEIARFQQGYGFSLLCGALVSQRRRKQIPNLKDRVTLQTVTPSCTQLICPSPVVVVRLVVEHRRLTPPTPSTD